MVKLSPELYLGSLPSQTNLQITGTA